MNIHLNIVYALISISIFSATMSRALDQPSSAAPALNGRLVKISQNDQSGGETPEKQGPKPQTPDPVVGQWQCTNSLQTMNLSIQGNGQLLIEEPTLGTVRRNTWTRIDDTRVSVYGGTPLEITFDGPDSFTLLNVNLRTTATCLRK